MTALRSEFGLTRFYGKLLGYTREQLAEADPAKAAAGYGISLEHAQGYIDQQRELKGVEARRRAA